ncbi:transketolase-like protein 2 [Mauremys mutica]|uniref:transketolase-like protein 2 n=1 Tax=Mauremys mutica TaxID=74926 RepID=UPI001D158FF0|nr:transketolase-like protein 2 [Mauremys mutica]
MASAEPRPEQPPLQALRDAADRLRVRALRATSAAGSGHPTSCCSAAEIMAVLFFQAMRYRARQPAHPSNDRFVLSKGHAAPLLYAAWAEAGFLKEPELLNLRKIDSDLEGHPTPRLPFVDVATGSLGQGLGAACGMAYVGKYFDRASYRVFCLLGDGEVSEGSVWEALAFGSHYRLDNLVAIVDVNRLGQSEAAPLGHDMDVYRRRCEAFGWNTDVVDGHAVEELDEALRQAAQVKGKPTAILAKTYKGRGVPGVEDAENWHGKPMPKDKVESIIGAIQSRIQTHEVLVPQRPIEDVPQISIAGICMPSPPEYALGDKVATRKAYGVALAKLGAASERVVALDGDTKNSTFCELFKQAHPERYIECYIAEQNMVSVALGCAARDRAVVFASTFAAFFTRAFDHIRMGAISRANLNLCGSHCGVSIGEDGPSQMALEDIAMFRAIPGCSVFYPSDAVSTERAVCLAANTKGICFIRTSRPETPVIYPPEETFEIGQAKVVRTSAADRVTVIGAGVTLHEALAAAAELAKQGIHIRVIDPFTIKPLDAATIVTSARATGGRILTVEDHYREGGIGEAVAAAVAGEPGVVLQSLAVCGVPRSGKPAELLDLFGISTKSIVAAVKNTFAN